MTSSNMVSMGQRDTMMSMGGQAMVSGTFSSVMLHKFLSCFVCLFVCLVRCHGFKRQFCIFGVFRILGLQAGTASSMWVDLPFLNGNYSAFQKAFSFGTVITHLSESTIGLFAFADSPTTLSTGGFIEAVRQPVVESTHCRSHWQGKRHNNCLLV